MTNINSETLTLYDDKKKRILRIQVTDVENNQTYSRDITIEKTVERRRTGAGQEVLGVRKNSYGDSVYLVQATEEEFTTKENAQVSKVLRTQILRIIPGWLQDEAREVIMATSRQADIPAPDAAKRRIFDMFAALGVAAAELKEYLGRDKLDPMPPQELADLRTLHAALREGHVRWGEVLADAKAARKELAGPQDGKPGPRSQGALAKIKAQRAAEPKEDAPAAPEAKPVAKKAPGPEVMPWERRMGDTGPEEQA